MKAAIYLTTDQLTVRMSVLLTRQDEIASELIAAGRGYERPSDIRTKSDPLSVRYVECADDLADCRAERQRRLEYRSRNGCFPTRVREIQE